MSKINDGGTAFPFVCQDISKYQAHEGGMSLRDYFAAKAAEGWLSTFIDESGHPAIDGTEKAETKLKNFAKSAYAIADAMIAERDKQYENKI